jgi:glycosyltransferase involved in cell wall biosynthesis
MNDLVSVIIPTYNCARYLPEAIGSVLSQTYGNWEMIIVDDGSDDGTDSLVAGMEEPRIRLFRHEARRGAAAARNTALREARGRWIAFLDSDDIWEKDKLARQLEFMESNGYSFSYTNYMEIDEHSRPTGRMVTGPSCIGERRMYSFCWPGCLTVMYDAHRTGLIQTADVDITDDYAIWLQVVRHCDCHLLDMCLARHRNRSGSLSKRGIAYKVRCHYHLFRVVEKKSRADAVFLTTGNLVFGVLKKLLYVKKCHH